MSLFVVTPSPAHIFEQVVKFPDVPKGTSFGRINTPESSCLLCICICSKVKFGGWGLYRRHKVEQTSTSAIDTHNYVIFKRTTKTNSLSTATQVRESIVCWKRVEGKSHIVKYLHVFIYRSLFS